MPVLHKSAYVMIELRVASRVVRFVRSARPFGDAATARIALTEWARALEGQNIEELGLLLDWRLAPLETDPLVLREVVERTDTIGRRFARQALLMLSALGALQAGRLARVHDSAPVVFTDEQAAFDYAMKR